MNAYLFIYLFTYLFYSKVCTYSYIQVYAELKAGIWQCQWPEVSKLVVIVCKNYIVITYALIKIKLGSLGDLL